MTTEEHLDKILSKCHALLALSEKRTPGKWDVNEAQTWDRSVGVEPAIVQRNAWTSSEDAAFIAACAGAAEAGWRATIAAVIDILPYLRESDAAHGSTEAGSRFLLTHRAKAIIAAWPEELL